MATASGAPSGFPGYNVPLDGNAERVQDSSAIDVMTLTLNSSVSSTTGGRALVTQKSTGGELFAVHYDGVAARRHIIAAATGSSEYNVSASESGSLIVVGADASKEKRFILPTAEAGLWYEFYQAGAQCASLTKVVGAAGLMVTCNDSGSSAVAIGGATNACIGASLRVICDGTQWLTIPQTGQSSVALSTACHVFPRAS